MFANANEVNRQFETLYICHGSYYKSPDETPVVLVVLRYADHLSFNSPGQWRRFRETIADAPRRVSCGLRVNPEHSTGAVPLYDPCAPGSRLGTRARDLTPEVMEGLEGLHFHTLCEQNFAPLARTLDAVEAQLGLSRWWRLPTLCWVFGGGWFLHVLCAGGIGLAVAATTFSIVVVFVPIGFLGGVAEQWMAPFALTIAFSVLVSLLKHRG